MPSRITVELCGDNRLYVKEGKHISSTIRKNSSLVNSGSVQNFCSLSVNISFCTHIIIKP